MTRCMRLCKRLMMHSTGMPVTSIHVDLHAGVLIGGSPKENLWVFFLSDIFGIKQNKFFV